MRLTYPHLPQSVAFQSYLPNKLTLLENECIIAPITSQCSGLAKANLTHGVRKVILNRIKGKKYGLRMRAVNQGVFIQLVAEGSPAAAAGIRFGDQLLNLNGTEVVGMTGQKVMDLMKKSKHEVILVLRDRPLARTITLHKDAAGLLGFSFKDNLITAVMQETSASRNGLLINQRIIEIDGRNVMAFKNKAMKSCLDDAPMTVTLTLMPAEFYDEITKK
uniref:PDZ domain-containing protein n=1 Tax=Elaeophora elaphi TaxID=1147741 RepID=A0A0R3RSZ8_9BILA